MSLKGFIIILIVVIVGVAGIYLLVEKPVYIFGPAKSPVINSFEECLGAGYPIMESYPRQCKTPEGQTFVEDIGNALEKADLIRVDEPSPNDLVQNPLTVTGEARGYWFFEASFPVKMLDDKGNLLGTAVAQAQSDWMTEDFVPFSATLEFGVPTTLKGKLVLEKDNPSGLPENADELRIPVIFGQSERTVKLYYYNQELDKDETGNILCSRKGLVAVEREIPVTQTPIQDTIRLLLQGELTQEEKDEGITTEYPLEGFSLTGALLEDGNLTLEFADPNSKSVGGSCRVGILWFQIEATASQFPEVKSVKFLPEEIFQP
jgi:hypothetical protein